MVKNHNTFPHKPFYFIRHGETDWNRRNIIMGSMDIPLNELGHAQAQKAAQILDKEDFDIIISSPRIRAHQTAEIIAVKTKKPLVFAEGLVERMWGVAEGQPFDSTKSLFDDAHAPQGAETFSAFQHRVIETVSSLLLLEKRPLLVSHGGVFKALVHHFGYQDMSSANCTPFFLRPPVEPSHPWGIYSLSHEKMDHE